MRRELVDRVAVNGTVIVTWANAHYLDFVLNWVHHLHLLNLGCYLVGAMDDALLQVHTCVLKRLVSVACLRASCKC